MKNISNKTLCPKCGNQAIWSKNNTWRPFCSERCKMIDLGEWLNEEKIIIGTKNLVDD